MLDKMLGCASASQVLEMHATCASTARYIDFLNELPK